MHGTLLYPLPGRPRLTGRKVPNIRKLRPGLRKRISMWKRILLAEFLHRAGVRSR